VFKQQHDNKASSPNIVAPYDTTHRVPLGIGPCSQLTVLPQWTAVLLAVPASLAVEQIDTLTANIGDRSDHEKSLGIVH